MAFLTLKGTLNFSLRLLMKSCSTVNLKAPTCSINQTHFANKLVLIWLYLIKMRIILRRKRCFNKC